jgi:deoxyribonuclease V
MRLHHRHSWDVTPAEAVAIQRRLSGEVVTVDALPPVARVAGVDVGFEDNGAVTRAAVAVLRFPELTVEETSLARRPTAFPYIPGLLSFREIPAVLDALGQLRRLPDLLLCDGQGQAHPRRFGIACHLGVLTDLPSIGVAKSRLTGTHGPLAEEKGAWQPLMDKGELIGTVLRTRRGVQPLYISVGHRISLQTAVDYVLRCTTRYRLPETTRAAHHLASNKSEEGER